MRSKTILLALLVLSINAGFAQTGSYWTAISNNNINQSVFERNYKPTIYKSFQLNESAIRADLQNAPKEGSIAITASKYEIEVPTAQGVLEKFRIVESPIMEQGLADQFPQIKTYLGYSLDNAGSTIRFDLSPNGFNAIILSATRKTTYINAVDHTNSYYVVFDRDGMAVTIDSFECKTDKIFNKSSVAAVTASADATRRTYRLALTVNGEFSQACLNGTETNDAQRKAKVLAVLTTNLNRANAVYDRDFNVRMIYVTGMENVLFLNSLTDPFTDETDQDPWNDDTQSTLDAIIGNGNYDIGHFIAKVSHINFENGNAGCIGCVCKSATKGSGFTAHTNIQGDPLVIDYWTHEMGHQFGGNHTFSYQTEGTGANMEPGSGSTIMGYAGITSSWDVQLHSDDYFHAKTIDQITSYVQTGFGNTCPVTAFTGNAVPVANAGSNYTIPKSTPFMLTGQGTDANASDVLTYTWEQYNNYTTGSNTFPSATATTGPVFRSRTYSTSPTRIFPEINSILSGANGNTWEALPSVARTMAFRFTVRDNSVLGGANNYANNTITVDATTGPFQVTAPNTLVSWKVGEFQTVTWNVAGTTGGSVNCSNVAIELSTDGGHTFPYVLAASTTNDGSHEIQVPNNITSQARVRVRGVGNVFFDISNANFSIAAAPAGDFVFNNPDAIGVCSGNPISFTLNTGSLASYSTPISLSASGNPGGSTVVFSTPTVTPGNSVTVSLSGTVPAGLYNIVVTGISGSITKTRTISINVISGSSTPTLSTPSNNATSQATTPTLTWSAFAGASSYTVDVSTSSSFATIIDTKSGLTGTSYTLTSALNSSTLYYWRVTAITNCGNLVSQTFSFTTGGLTCGTLTSTNVPVFISSIGASTVTSTMNVSSSGNISSVKVVGLKFTHTYIGDLTISLKSPAGTSRILFENSCASTAYANMNINFDDAASSATIPCPPTGGITRRPKQSLSAFANQSITGAWILTTTDDYDDDGGSLDAWGLNFCITGGTLPVSWLDFTARRSAEKAVQLQWKTATEINNKEFQVERSRDGSNFEVIGTVSAGGNGSGIQQYIYNDLKPFTGINYYRLKQVDKDGSYKYSSVAKVAIDQDRSLYSISPNPAISKANLTIYKEMKQVNVKVMDVSGKTIYTLNKPVINAGETILLPVTQMAKGYYLVIIESEAERFTEKLIVQ
jgi:subtilisin-like proprotein convertase family protein